MSARGEKLGQGTLHIRQDRAALLRSLCAPAGKYSRKTGEQVVEYDRLVLEDDLPGEVVLTGKPPRVRGSVGKHNVQYPPFSQGDGRSF